VGAALPLSIEDARVQRYSIKTTCYYSRGTTVYVFGMNDRQTKQVVTEDGELDEAQVNVPRSV
jgi:hypothetical protein